MLPLPQYRWPVAATKITQNIRSADVTRIGKLELALTVARLATWRSLILARAEAAHDEEKKGRRRRVALFTLQHFDILTSKIKGNVFVSSKMGG